MLPQRGSEQTLLRAGGCSAGSTPRLAGPTHRGDDIMKWEKPAACDMRFGFEITMYIAVR
jgi:coenzyme PQQ precursor peptide PqqA